MKKVVTLILASVFIASQLVACGQQVAQNTTATSNQPVSNETSNNIVAPDGTEYKYRFELTGRLPNAAKDSSYIVLTNNPNLTFEEVTKSLFSSDSADALIDTYIVSMK